MQCIQTTISMSKMVLKPAYIVIHYRFVIVLCQPKTFLFHYRLSPALSIRLSKFDNVQCMSEHRKPEELKDPQLKKLAKIVMTYFLKLDQDWVVLTLTAEVLTLISCHYDI